MKTTMHLVPLDQQSITAYAKASRRLRRKVGNKAPTTVDLINFELAGRDPGDIASCYLDYLRDLERCRQVVPGRQPTGRRPVSPAPMILRETAWPTRRSSVPMTDPTRN